jgi:hypothetical protein
MLRRMSPLCRMNARRMKTGGTIRECPSTTARVGAQGPRPKAAYEYTQSCAQLVSKVLCWWSRSLPKLSKVTAAQCGFYMGKFWGLGLRSC